MELRFVEALRRVEIGLALDEMRARKPLGSSIVEIGGGAGWQAKALEDAGFHVRSFDLPGSEFADQRAFPIEDYDGHRIPADDATFDIAFSSNVLEHIPHVEAFQQEIRRVLKPDGIVVHLVPSATWRIHTLLAHYPWLVRAFLEAARSKLGRGDSKDARIVASAAARRTLPQLASRVLFAPRHGEKGNAFTEIWYFSRYRWNRLFNDTGWQIVSYRSSGLFYTGALLLNERLPVETRTRMSSSLGSACHLYVLRSAI